MYNFDILDVTDDFNIVKIGIKKFYNTDKNYSLSEWLSSKEIGDELMTLISDANSVEKNTSFVRFTNEKINNNNRRYKIGIHNFYYGCVMFSVRKLIPPTWINMKDEYYTPNENNSNFENFKLNAVIYSIFNVSSGNVSKDNIKNEFFWMSKEEMTELANNNNYNELYSDARTDNNRYVHNLLFGEENIYEQLSPDAKLVLDKATELVQMSMTMRSHFADDHNHLNSWDAGYAQLKLVWKEYFPEEFKEFRQLYKNLEDRMRPLVYELGFLLK
jgi:hypothetical protein